MTVNNPYDLYLSSNVAVVSSFALGKYPLSTPVTTCPCY